MHVVTKTRRRRNRITGMNFKRHCAFDKLDESHLEYDSFEHGNKSFTVVTKTSSVILSLLLINFTGNELCLPSLQNKRFSNNDGAKILLQASRSRLLQRLLPALASHLHKVTWRFLVAVGVDTFQLWRVATNVLSNCWGIYFGLIGCN